jgi:hypothetical protein
MLEDPIKFSKFRYERGVMLPYWVGQSPSQGMFPKNNISISCKKYEVGWGSIIGHGVLDISRDHIVSCMGAFVDGALHPFICNATFFQALYFPFFVFYGLNIECYVQWKEKEHENATQSYNTLCVMCTIN